MAAITPGIGRQRFVSRLDSQYFKCVGEAGVGLSGALGAGACPAPAEIMSQSHTGLLQMVYVRSAIERMFEGRSFTVMSGRPGRRKDGSPSLIDPDTVYLVLDGPAALDPRTGERVDPVWNPMASPQAAAYQLLSWTSKMNCPSWSLPAGALETGGTCPGAQAGQSLVPMDRLLAKKRFVDRVLGRQPQGVELDLSNAVCEHCYAEGGQYSTGGVQAAQVLRHIWVKQAVRTPYRTQDGRESTLFIETMIAAILGANFQLHGGSAKIEETELDGHTAQETIQKLPPEQSGRRFFRIHDSGDFFSPEYLAQWKAVANFLPHIVFWAPSRVWAVSPQWIDAVNRINTPLPNGARSNLVIRPSAYYVNEPAPDFRKLGPGWAAGSTVIAKKANLGMTPARERWVAEHEGGYDQRAPGGPDPRYDWDCRAYAIDDQGHTCRKAVAPPELAGPGGIGCRACWLAPDEVVNYTLH